MSALPNPQLRQQVIAIYKDLLHLGKQYPLGFAYFRPRLHKAFMAKAALRNDDEIRKGIQHAEYVRKVRMGHYALEGLGGLFFWSHCPHTEIEALYYLKRYRTLQRRYGNL